MGRSRSPPASILYYKKIHVYRKVEAVLQSTRIYSPFIFYYWHLPIRFRKCHLPSPVSPFLSPFIYPSYFLMHFKVVDISTLFPQTLQCAYHNSNYISVYLLLLFSSQVVSNSLQPQGLWHARLSFTISWSLLKLMSLELVMPSNHLLLCCPRHIFSTLALRTPSTEE